MTLSAGFQGGEVTPLFSIGASLGAAMAGLFGLPVPFVAALGYAAVFGGATNTFWLQLLLEEKFSDLNLFRISLLYVPFPMCLMQINLFIYKKQKTR